MPSNQIDPRTKAIIRQTAMRGEGQWEPNIIDQNIAGSDLVYLYVWDEPSYSAWMCGVDRVNFQKIARAASVKSKKTIQEIRDSLNSIIVDAVKNNFIFSGTSQDAEAELHLANYLIMYAGTTQTWQHLNWLENGGHFIVIRYEDKANGLLRPFASPANTDYPILYKDLENAVAQVIESDLKRHPEWFRK